MAEAFRRGKSVEEVASLTKWDPFFLRRISGLVAAEKTLFPQVMANQASAYGQSLGFPGRDLGQAAGSRPWTSGGPPGAF
ncbi:MAG: hypothetical protein ACUVRQ_10440, partial [Thermoanaerobaculaceae bacterium]